MYFFSDSSVVYSCSCHVLLAEFRTSVNLTGFFVFGFTQLHSKFFNKLLHNRAKSVNFDHEIFMLHYFFQKLNAAVVILVCWTRLSLFLVCFCIPSFPVCFDTPSFFGMYTCLMYAIYSTNFALFTTFRGAKSCLKKIQLFFCRLPLTDILEEVCE